MDVTPVKSHYLNKALKRNKERHLRQLIIEIEQSLYHGKEKFNMLL